MLKHLFTITFRHFARHKNSFFINLLSLTSGFIGALFIFLWIQDEMKVDQFHSKDDRLYKVMSHQEFSGSVITKDFTPGPMASALMEEVPEVEYATNIVHWFDKFTLSVGEETSFSKGYYAEKDFFNVFDFDLIAGTADEVLKVPNSIVISKELANVFFGSVENAIGKSIELERREEMMVTGVFESVPDYSSLQFEFILPWESFIAQPRFQRMDSWFNSGPYTMLTLKEGANVAEVEKKIQTMVQSRHEEDIETTFFLKKFSDSYLYGKYENGVVAGGRIEYVRLFGIIGLFILFIACINFMNLATARASRRVKEVGIKKTLGIKKRTLVLQYLLESTALSFVALLIAFAIVQLFLPAFNLMTGKEIGLSLNPSLFTWSLGMVFLTGLLAGSYPAFYLSSFKPVKVLKGFFSSQLGVLWIRRSLVVFQFGISIILIIAVLVIYKQVDFIQNKNLGYDRTHLIQFLLNIENNEHISSFVAEAKNLPGVSNISSGNTPINHRNRTSSVNWEGKDPESSTLFYTFAAHYDLLETMEVELKEGRSFSNKFGEERRRTILNEEAVKVMGLENPIGKTITLYDEVELEVIGIAKDFHFQSIHEPIQPLIFRCMEHASPMLVAKLEGGNYPKALSGLKTLYEKFNPGVPFDFEFINQEYNQLYTSEQKVASLSKLFALLAILISCLGLFGLTIFNADRRKKEIGIRKVMGASTFNIIGLLSKEFMQLVMVALLISVPIAWHFSNEWLTSFAYAVKMEWWIVAMAGGAAIFMAFATMSFQSVKAALANPVAALRND